MPFLRNVGAPQGDSLSPGLFIVAVEKIRNTENMEETVPTELAYADVFISLTKYKAITEVSKILNKFNKLVNNDKTEYTKVNRK